MSIVPFHFLLFSLLLTTACSSTKTTVQTEKPVVIRVEKNIAENVGEFVRLEGVVINSKIPTLLGVDINCPDELRGKKAFAEGKLVSWTVSPEDVDPYSANRGPGTYYKLLDPDKGELAKAQVLE